MNKVYGEYFSDPYPNRATVVVAALLVPEAKVEIVAYAHLGANS
jgi:enamine deaminase RidA (YjgF/YER057c/UK114 family)